MSLQALTAPFRWFVSAAALALPAAADVLVVDAAGGGQHTQIAAAVAAASPGDVLLVKTGVYTGFVIDAKSLSVAGDAGAAVTVGGSIGVRNLAAGQTVVLSGLTSLNPAVGSSTADPIYGTGLFVVACQGALRAQQCQFQGASGGSSSCFGTVHVGRPGVYIETSLNVAFERCTLIGGEGGKTNGQCWCGSDGKPGGDGLLLRNSLLAFYDCTAIGGKGGRGAELGGNGGQGAQLFDGLGMLTSNSSFQGGQGGIADAGPSDPGGLCLLGEGGDGGHGLYVRPFGQVLSAAQLVGGSYAGGAGGIPFNGQTGSPGQPTAGPNQFILQGPARVLVAPAIAREGTTLPLTFEGVPGDMVTLRFSAQPGFQHIIPLKGVLLTHNTRPERIAIVGTIPASGTLSSGFDLLDLGAGVAAGTYFLQAQFTSAQGGSWLGSFTALTVLDSAF